MNTSPDSPSWNPPPRPAWLKALNDEAAYFEPQQLAPLDARELIETARNAAGLENFGEDYWREPLEILCADLQGPAELTLMGRLMARNDLLTWLGNRLQITEIYKRFPQIADEEICEPFFIVGLPRSGTSILFELLSQDQDFGVPMTWEAMFPCPPPETASYKNDPRIARAHGLATQWSRVTPEFAAMHEMGGQIPAECGLIMANSFISDHIAALHQAPGYAAFYESAEMSAAYEYHRDILKILQWKNPRKRWLLKAPAHQNHLDTLLKIYPDARIIQTHRDPLRCMDSATSLMGALYYMRSDKPFDASAFEDFLKGEATAKRLELVMDQRAQGIVPDANICDSRYQDLMKDAPAAIARIYEHFGMELGDQTRRRAEEYLAAKPKHAGGRHAYEQKERGKEERSWFARYQQTYQVPNEPAG